jgi:D-glycero-D-manno-heptose 1,7-bisphosphate phosphatase
MSTAFLDRDGVINRAPQGDYVKSWEEFEFLPGVFDALRALKQHGFRLIVVTNQRGVSLGRPPESGLRAIHDRMEAELRKAGAGLDAIYYCPHGYDACNCRKPETELFLQAQRDFPDIRFADSFVIGDSITDMEAAARLYCKRVLIGAESSPILAALAKKNLAVDFTAPSLLEAVKGFLIQAGRSDRAGKPSKAQRRPAGVKRTR